MLLPYYFTVPQDRSKKTMIGTQEMILIFAAILILFGASKLPELARSVGKATGEFRKAKIESEKEIADLKKTGDLPWVKN